MGVGFLETGSGARVGSGIWAGGALVCVGATIGVWIALGVTDGSAVMITAETTGVGAVSACRQAVKNAADPAKTKIKNIRNRITILLSHYGAQSMAFSTQSPSSWRLRVISRLAS